MLVDLTNGVKPAAEPPPEQRRRLLSLARLKIQLWLWRVARLLNQSLRGDVLLLLLSPDDGQQDGSPAISTSLHDRPGSLPLVLLRSNTATPALVFIVKHQPTLQARKHDWKHNTCNSLDRLASLRRLTSNRMVVSCIAR